MKSLSIVALLLTLLSRSVLAADATKPHKGAPPQNEVPAAARAVLARWEAMKFVPFSQLSDAYSEVRLSERKAGNETLKAPPGAHQVLQGEARRVLQALRASSFKDFSSAIQTGFNPPLPITSRAVAGMRKSLNLMGLLEETATPSDTELQENFWLLHTKAGRGSSYFAALAPGDSYYTLRRLTSMEEAKVSPGHWYQQNLENLGVMVSESMFSYGLTAREAFARDKSLLVADLRLLLKCEREGQPYKAYPIVVRYFWDSRRDLWIPTHIAELYGGIRDIRPMF